MKISQCKCGKCKAEFEVLKSDEKVACPSCNGKEVEEISAKEIDSGCQGGCSGCGQGCS